MQSTQGMRPLDLRRPQNPSIGDTLQLQQHTAMSARTMLTSLVQMPNRKLMPMELKFKLKELKLKLKPLRV